jgi:hypothetical protein
VDQFSLPANPLQDFSATTAQEISTVQNNTCSGIQNGEQLNGGSGTISRSGNLITLNPGNDEIQLAGAQATISQSALQLCNNNLQATGTLQSVLLNGASDQIIVTTAWTLVNNGCTQAPAASGASAPGNLNTISPALSFENFSMSGLGGSNPIYSTYQSTGAYIDTGDTLKVEVIASLPSAPLQAPPGYPNFSSNYGCISYSVSLYDQAGTLLNVQRTEALAVNGGSTLCSGSPSSQVLDFSAAILNAQRGVDVQIQPADYDWFCQFWNQQNDLYGASSPYFQDYSNWCFSTSVYSGHEVNASIEVQVNGTEFF